MRARALVAAVAVTAILLPSVARAADGDPDASFGTNGRIDVLSTTTPPVTSLVGSDGGLYLSHGAPGTVTALTTAPAVTCLTACRVEPLGPRAAVLVDGDTVRSLPSGTQRFQRPGTTIARITALGSGPGFAVEHGPDATHRTLALVPPTGPAFDLLDEAGQPAPAGAVATLPFTRFAVASAAVQPAASGPDGATLTVRWYGAGPGPEALHPAARRDYPGQSIEVLAAVGADDGGLHVLVGRRPSTENADGWPVAVEAVRFDADGAVDDVVPIVTRKWSPTVVTLSGRRGLALVGTSVHVAVADPPAETWATHVDLDPVVVTSDRTIPALRIVDAAVAGLDGDLVLSGSATLGPRTDVTLVHLGDDGGDDPTFGNAGAVTIPLDRPTTRATALARLGDGGVVAAASQDASVVLYARQARVRAPVPAIAYPWEGDFRAAFTPVTPTRLLDTRVSGGRLEPGEARPVGVRGVVPAEAIAAAVTVTAVDVDGAGFARFVAGDPAPTTSTLNFSRPGETVANTTIVYLGTDATVPLLSSTGAHYVIDLTGYWVPRVSAASGRLRPVTSARVLDTRESGGPLAAGTTLDLSVAGRGGVPSDGVSAVVLTVTSVDAAGPGFVTVWPGGDRPLASTLNPAGGDIRSNLAIVPVDARGHVLLYTHGRTDLVVDVQSWFTDATAPSSSGGLFVGQRSRRALDTRQTDEPTLTGGAERVVDLEIGHDLTAVINLTAADTPSGGFITAYPWTEPLPLASVVNVDGAGQNRAAMVFVRNVLGRVSLYSNVSTAAVVDVLGWFTPSG